MGGLGGGLRTCRDFIFNWELGILEDAAIGFYNSCRGENNVKLPMLRISTCATNSVYLGCPALALMQIHKATVIDDNCSHPEED